MHTTSTKRRHSRVRVCCLSDCAVRVKHLVWGQVVHRFIFSSLFCVLVSACSRQQTQTHGHDSDSQSHALYVDHTAAVRGKGSDSFASSLFPQSSVIFSFLAVFSVVVWGRLVCGTQAQLDWRDAVSHTLTRRRGGGKGIQNGPMETDQWACAPPIKRVRSSALFPHHNFCAFCSHLQCLTTPQSRNVVPSHGSATNKV